MKILVKYPQIGGAITGALLAFINILSTSLINRWFMPAIPFYDSEASLGNILLYVVTGALIGMVAVWPESAWVGVILSGMLGGVLLYSQTWIRALTSPSGSMGEVFWSIYTLLPMMVFFMPLGWLVRSAFFSMMGSVYNPLYRRDLRMPLIALVLAIGLGAAALYPKDVRDSFAKMDNLVQMGLAAGSHDAAPEAFAHADGFPEDTLGTYTLQYTGELELFQWHLPAAADSTNAYLIVARFENDYAVACVYGEVVSYTVCSNFNPFLIE